MEQLVEIAQALKSSDIQCKTMENTKPETQLVNYVRLKKSHKPDTAQQFCYARGKSGHFGKDSYCPAKNKSCRKCKMTGRFEKMCKIKVRPNKPSKGKSNRRNHVRHVNEGEETDSESDSEYVFSLQSEKSLTMMLEIGGIKMKGIVDSGADVNVMDKSKWEYLKSQKVTCSSRLTDKELYAYGSDKALSVLGSFPASVSAGEKAVEEEFYVVKETGPPLLSKTLCVELGVLNISIPDSAQIHKVTDMKDLKQTYLECFTGTGKLKDFQLHVPIDKTVKPVVQSARRIPYCIRDKLEKKRNELVDYIDIIEKVKGPSNSVSPVVVVPKPNNDIRLCVDMREPNCAMQRERFQIPTVDEILQDLNGSEVFSKLDIKWAYHQTELAEESRPITTFMTHKCAYRYKRLMFGMNCAPEIYNRIISKQRVRVFVAYQMT